MKKITWAATFLFFLATYTYGQKGYTQIGTIKGRGNTMDTIINKKTELSFGKVFPNNYKIDPGTVNALKPYFVSDIINPTNTTHPLYLERVREAREILPRAKVELMELMKSSPTKKRWMSKAGINSEADINAITYVFIPIYYITPNIVFFKNGENIAKYYNLGRACLKYLMLRNNLPIGYLDVYDHKTDLKCKFFPVRSVELESYRQIIKLGGKPIGIRQDVVINPNYAGHDGVNPYAYLEQGHLIFSYYEEGVTQRVGTDIYVAPNPRFYKTYTVETEESFFSGGGNRSILNNWIDSTVKNMKK